MVGGMGRRIAVRAAGALRVGDALQTRTVPLSQTTTVFNQQSTAWFAAPERPTVERQQSSISHPAPLLKASLT
jgi:hypothetical protein